MVDLPRIPNFSELEWKVERNDPNEDPDYEHWRLYDNGDFVGEVYQYSETSEYWKWHCMVSDWKEDDCASVEQAKLNLVVNYVKHLMHRYADARSEAFAKANPSNSELSRLLTEKNAAIQLLVNEKAALEARLHLQDTELVDLKDMHDTLADSNSLLTNMSAEKCKQIVRQVNKDGLTVTKADLKSKAKKLITNIDSLVTLDINGGLPTELDATARNLLTQSHAMISTLIL
jgi:hypothetical protein